MFNTNLSVTNYIKMVHLTLALALFFTLLAIHLSNQYLLGVYHMSGIAGFTDKKDVIPAQEPKWGELAKIMTEWIYCRHPGGLRARA